MLQKLYRVEVILHAPEGVRERFTTAATTENLATTAVDELKARCEQLADETADAEAQEANAPVGP